ncbi:MAG: homoserine dehydrogenase, partial [Alphaproteobacteria bacterium]|nr:homoserine dehydrogenase [Alphaproteobacteria bacterium]
MHNKPPLRLGIAGLGTVGSEVARIIETQGQQLAIRTGRDIVITAVSARDKTKKRSCSIKSAVWVANPVDMAARDDVDAVVELIGGSEGAARDLAIATLKASKAYITANKALLAHHGQELAALSEKHKAPLYCEAAVAGGIPVIKTMRESLAGNTLKEVYGILNGTCNYILTSMRATGRNFPEVLAEAQALGYAEADPTFDIDGLDTAHKLAILSSLAFGAPVDLASLSVSGIRNITTTDIIFAEELGYRIKLLGVTRLTEKGLMQRVSPYMVPVNAQIAHVDDVLNAVFIEGSILGPLTLIGRGAGGGPTASSVLSDIIDVADGRIALAFAIPVAHLQAVKPLAPADSLGSFYIRLMVADKAGVLADLAAILRDENISIQSLLQKGRSEAGPVPVVFITHDSNEKA